MDCKLHICTWVHICFPLPRPYKCTLRKGMHPLLERTAHQRLPSSVQGQSKDKEPGRRRSGTLHPQRAGPGQQSLQAHRSLSHSQPHLDDNPCTMILCKWVPSLVPFLMMFNWLPHILSHTVKTGKDPISIRDYVGSIWELHASALDQCASQGMLSLMQLPLCGNWGKANVTNKIEME